MLYNVVNFVKLLFVLVVIVIVCFGIDLLKNCV